MKEITCALNLRRKKHLAEQKKNEGRKEGEGFDQKDILIRLKGNEDISHEYSNRKNDEDNTPSARRWKENIYNALDIS